MIKTEDENILQLKRSITWAELKDSLDNGGCPICNLMIQKIEKYFEYLLYEYASDPSVHKKNLASFGLCNVHSHLLKDIENKLKSDGLNVAVLYETLFQKEEKLLNKVLDSVDDIQETKIFKKKKSLNTNKENILNNLLPKGTCIGCLQQKETESYYTHEILRIFKDEEFIKKYESENVLLCRNHFLFLINESMGNDAIRYFIKTQKMKIESLHQKLKKFIYNHDYKIKSSLTENELNSWEKTLEYFGSKKNLGKNLYNDLSNT